MDGAVFFWDLFPGTMRSEHYNGKIGTMDDYLSVYVFLHLCVC
jgi:hypothetical protein